jgi:hypothetical protein
VRPKPVIYVRRIHDHCLIGCVKETDVETI